MMRWGPTDILDRLTGGRFSGARRGTGHSAAGDLLGVVGAVVSGFFVGLSVFIRQRWFQVLSAFVVLLIVIDVSFGDGSSAWMVGGLHVVLVGILGARLRSRRARYEAQVREVVAGVVHDRSDVREG